MSAPEISVVVPLYNERENLRELTERLARSLATCASSYELVYVDDGSTDGSREMFAELITSEPRLRVLLLARNYGQEPAVQAGMLSARGRWVVQIDGDLQNPPEEIPKLVEEARKGYEIVYGRRAERRDATHRVLGSWLLVKCMRGLFGITLPDDVSTFRVIDGELARYLAGLPEKHKFFSALVGWSGARASSLPVAHAARQRGASKYDLFKLASHSLDLLAGFSFRPLRIIGGVGVFFAGSACVYAAYKVLQKLTGTPIQIGYTSLFAAVVLMGGFNLIALSVIGEYVGRIFMQTQNRPLFRVAAELCAQSLANGAASVGERSARTNHGELARQ